MAILTNALAIYLAVREAVSEHEPCIAAPFWGLGVLEQIGLNGRDDLKVLCNLSSGMCDPKAIEHLLTAGSKVRSLSTLHAKVYMGRSVAIVGSANPTLSALGIRGAANSMEVCVRLCGDEDLGALRAWFQCS